MIPKIAKTRNNLLLKKSGDACMKSWLTYWIWNPSMQLLLCYDTPWGTCLLCAWYKNHIKSERVDITELISSQYGHGIIADTLMSWNIIWPHMSCDLLTVMKWKWEILSTIVSLPVRKKYSQGWTTWINFYLWILCSEQQQPTHIYVYSTCIYIHIDYHSDCAMYQYWYMALSGW